MGAHGIVVIGGSTGALEGLKTIVAGLPPNLRAAVFVTIHTSADAPGVLDRILARAGSMPVSYPIDGDPIVAGHVYVAPGNRHLLVKPTVIRVTSGPRENRFRPAIDPLFRTAAAAYGPSVIGILLSGGQDDGVLGLAAIQAAGGAAIVQDPEEALVPSMPLAAIRSVPVDHVVPVVEIADHVCRLVGPGSKVPVRRELPPDVAEGGTHAIHDAAHLGPPAPFTCPDCGGTLWQFQTGEPPQFQCHVGHRYTAESLAAGQAEGLDRALWTGLRALEENAELRRRMARHAEARGMGAIASEYWRQAQEAEHRSSIIRRVLIPDPADRSVMAEAEPSIPQKADE